MNTNGESIFLALTDVDIRKLGEQTGLETPVVHAVKYGCYPRTKSTVHLVVFV